MLQFSWISLSIYKRIYFIAFSLLLQAVFQLIGVLYTFLFTSGGEGPNVIAISSIAIGSISLILGDLGRYTNFVVFFQVTSFLYMLLYHNFLLSQGRRRSRVILLKVYMVASSIGVLLSIACVAKGNVTLEVNWFLFQVLSIIDSLLEG